MFKNLILILIFLSSASFANLKSNFDTNLKNTIVEHCGSCEGDEKEEGEEEENEDKDTEESSSET